jgi:hypothetical protein
VAPAEGFYNEKTGDFAPKSGGFIDLNTGLYVAPPSDAKLDGHLGVYVSTKIGNIDADTGQYVAPKGLALDAKKGFILAEGDNDKTGDRPAELLALKQDLNTSIHKDVAVAALEEVAKVYNINEKFIRNRITFSTWDMNQKLAVNENTNSPYVELDSSGSARFQLDWQMATTGRFSPLVGVDYSIVNFKGLSGRSITQTSTKLIGLSYGVQYAFSEKFSFFGKLGLHQEHYLEQTSINWPFAYNLKKIVVSRLTAGTNAEFWTHDKWSAEVNAAFLFTFKKRINNVLIGEGTGGILEVLPKYKLSEKKWIALGLKIENQYQKITNSVAVNRQDRNTKGLELKYITDF